MAIPRTARFQSQVDSADTQEKEILSGWKDIANYLAKGVRTVQRYERELDLPILRRSGKSRGSVMAVKTELARWLCGSPIPLHSMPERDYLAHRSNKLKADFLQIDSEIGLTFSGIALGAGDTEKRTRTTRAARLAYDAITRLGENINLNEAERDRLDANLRRLKSELQCLGQRF